ncbi:MAG: hypothetical protein K8F91_16805 [Candidatus Obscuribacterales bacterium]|nr:hypothetical protein [Candidatus Obscuribacterales bacterium]
MSGDLDQNTDLIDLVTMQKDGSLRSGMKEAELEKIIDAWIVASESENSKSEEYRNNSWAIDEVASWTIEERPKLIWTFVSTVYNRKLSDRAFPRPKLGRFVSLVSRFEWIILFLSYLLISKNGVGPLKAFTRVIFSFAFPIVTLELRRLCRVRQNLRTLLTVAKRLALSNVVEGRLQIIHARTMLILARAIHILPPSASSPPQLPDLSNILSSGITAYSHRFWLAKNMRLRRKKAGNERNNVA